MTRSELCWVMVPSLAVILLASLPTIYAWALSDDDHVFRGFVYNAEDGNSYIAKMRLGVQSNCNSGGALIPDSVHGVGRITIFPVMQEEIRP